MGDGVSRCLRPKARRTQFDARCSTSFPPRLSGGAPVGDHGDWPPRCLGRPWMDYAGAIRRIRHSLADLGHPVGNKSAGAEDCRTGVRSAAGSVRTEKQRFGTARRVLDFSDRKIDPHASSIGRSAASTESFERIYPLTFRQARRRPEPKYDQRGMFGASSGSGLGRGPEISGDA